MTKSKTPYPTEVYSLMPNDFRPQVEVSACYLGCKDSYLFLLRAPGSLQARTWGVPAGKVEQGELPREAVIREVREEIGVNLDNALLAEVGSLYVRYPHVDFVYHAFAYEVSHQPPITLSAEHDEYRWVKPSQLAKLPLISGAIEAFRYFESWKKARGVNQK